MNKAVNWSLLLLTFSTVKTFEETNKNPCFLFKKCANLPSLAQLWKPYYSLSKLTVPHAKAKQCLKRYPLLFIGDSRIQQIKTITASIQK